MPIKDNEKQINAHEKSLTDDVSHISKTKEEFLKDENINADVKKVIDEVYTDIIKENIEDETLKVSSNLISSETNKVKTEHSKANKKKLETKDSKTNKKKLETKNSKTNKKKLETKEISLTKEEENLKTFYENKLKELNEKIDDYNNRYNKLEESIQRYEDRNQELIEKRIEFETSIKEFEQKNKELEDVKIDFKGRSDKIKEAREHFIEINKQLEQKKIDLEEREKQIRKIQLMLEKNKYDFEKNKIEFDKEKLEFEIGKAELEKTAYQKNINVYSELIEDQDKIKEKEEQKKGKAGILQEILQELSDNGAFHSCFLIDNKGMMISEYTEIELDSMAIGAMFSLICTIALRTIESLHLQALDFLKLTSANGEFLVKNININNYERNFILLTYFDGTTPFVPKDKQKMDKKTINKIMKSVKEDFYEFGQGKRISWIFDNLTEKINFLRQKYITPDTDIELKRLNFFNKTAIKIKELFES